MTIRDRIKEFRRVPAAELVANRKNWRKHPERQRQAMSAVLEEIGFAGALLARESDDGRLVLIDGHLRAETVTGATVPVLVLDVTEAESDKILATLDPLAGMAEVDGDAWAKLIDGIEYSTADFGDLLQELRPGNRAGNTDEDAAPDPPAVPVTRPGDLWQLGPHRLLCGDSTKAEDAERVFAGVKPMLMVTDPPYGVNYDPTWRDGYGPAASFAKDGKPGKRARGMVNGDDRADWFEAYSLFPGHIAYVWHGDLQAMTVARNLTDCGFKLRAQIVWRKQHFVFGRGDYHHQHEPCWYAVRGAGNWTGDRKQATIWDIQNLNPMGGTTEEKQTGHGTQKPVECMRRPILNHTNPGQAVYDPFLGSGTTIIAADTTGRVCYGMEIDPVYVDVAVKRWEEFTGKKATLETNRAS